MNPISYIYPNEINDDMAYAMITTRCNLSCPYCDIKSKDDGWDQDKFMETIRNFNGWILLFGGEPTLYIDRLEHVMYSDPIVSKKIKSITTNLMILNDRTKKVFKDLISGATSWNPSRFTKDEY